MRILHLDAGRQMRGGQWQVLRLLDGLKNEGVECVLLARAGAPLFAAARDRGHVVEALSVPRVVLLARRFDLLHAHDSRTHTVGALIRPSALLVSRRVAFPPRGAWKYAQPRHYLAVSAYVKQMLEAAGVPEAKISVVPDGVPLLEPAKGTALVAPDYTADPEKGSALAVEAAQMAGTEIRFSNDLERDLRGAALFVYITYQEGLGSGALMAMSAGVPVIASRVGGLREIIQHRETGILVDNRPEEIAAAIRELRENPPFARRLGDAARQSVIDKYTVAHMVRRTMDVYRRMAGLPDSSMTA